jgi:hypothetical protein
MKFKKKTFRLYLSWRRHYVLPDNDDHPFVGIMVLANEIILGEGYARSKTKTTGETQSFYNLQDNRTLSNHNYTVLGSCLFICLLMSLRTFAVLIYS